TQDLNLEPADRFKIAGGHAKRCAFALKVSKYLVDTGHLDQLHLGASRSNIPAHGFEYVFEVRLPVGLVKPGKAEGIAQNAGVRVPAQDDAIEHEFLAHRRANARKE